MTFILFIGNKIDFFNNFKKIQMTEYNMIEAVFPREFQILYNILNDDSNNDLNNLDTRINYIELMIQNDNENNFSNIYKKFTKKIMEVYPSLQVNIFIICILYYNNKLTKNNLIKCLNIINNTSVFDSNSMYNNEVYIMCNCKDNNFTVSDKNKEDILNYDIFDFDLPLPDYEMPYLGEYSWLDY